MHCIQLYHSVDCLIYILAVDQNEHIAITADRCELIDPLILVVFRENLQCTWEASLYVFSARFFRLSAA